MLTRLFTSRERPTVARFFSGLATMTWIASLGRTEPGAVRASHLLTLVDPTAPDDHQRDDIGTIMAWAIAQNDDGEARPKTRAAWRALIAALTRSRYKLESRRNHRS